MAQKLFAEFPPVSTKEWEEVIVKDLKGADYEKKLVWRSPEGFAVRPYYRAENLEGLEFLDSAPGQYPYVRGTGKSNDWYILQSVDATDGDFAKANKTALELLNKGVEALTIVICHKTEVSAEQWAVLLKDIALDVAPVYIKGISGHNVASVASWVEFAAKAGLNKETVRFCFDLSPLSCLVRSGRFDEAVCAKVKDAILAVEGFKRVKVLCIDGTAFANAGSNNTQELAYSLSQASEYINCLTELGLSATEAARRIWFRFNVGSNYFMEIAKFRAARLLWASIAKAYGTECCCAEKMYVHAVTSAWNQTVYDPYVNMLRATTEAMSAALAGVNSIEVLPFDYAFRTPNDFSNRIARNVQVILKHQALFDKVVDPAAGSYYIENLTKSIADGVWKLFKETEEAGGFLAQFKAGKIQEAIKATAADTDKKLATRRQTLLGTNQFPNFLEVAGKDITKEIVSKDIPTVNGKVIACNCPAEPVAEPLLPYRGAEAFEALRFATDRSGKEPKAFMLTYGNLAMCRARAQFSSNFFAVAGLRVIDNNRFETIEEGVKAFLESGADICVACSSDDEYAEGVPQIAELLAGKGILVVAGAPACQADLEAKGIKNFISVKSNVLETLKQYQAALGIKAL